LTSNETKRILETPAYLGFVVEPSSARRRLIRNRTKCRKCAKKKEGKGEREKEREKNKSRVVCYNDWP
jgi:hypothetical protein